MAILHWITSNQNVLLCQFLIFRNCSKDWYVLRGLRVYYHNNACVQLIRIWESVATYTELHWGKIYELLVAYCIEAIRSFQVHYAYFIYTIPVYMILTCCAIRLVSYYKGVVINSWLGAQSDNFMTSTLYVACQNNQHACTHLPIISIM